jgi:hypothetical protein
MDIVLYSQIDWFRHKPVIASRPEGTARQSHSNVIPAKAGIQILDHPVKSRRDPADRMVTVVADGIAPEGTGSSLVAFAPRNDMYTFGSKTGQFEYINVKN